MELTTGKIRVRVVPLGSVYTCPSNRDEELTQAQRDERDALSDKNRWQSIIPGTDQHDSNVGV